MNSVIASHSRVFECPTTASPATARKTVSDSSMVLRKARPAVSPRKRPS
jgi:hypothetical protein